MNPLQQTKVMSIIKPVAIVDNTKWTTTQIDTKGFDYGMIIFHLGTSDIAMAALAVTQSDSDGSSHVNVTGLIVGTSINSAGSTSNQMTATDDDAFILFDLDLKSMKRYIDLTATAGDGTNGSFAACCMVMYRSKIGPDTAAERGADQVLSSPAYSA